MHFFAMTVLKKFKFPISLNPQNFFIWQAIFVWFYSLNWLCNKEVTSRNSKIHDNLFFQFVRPRNHCPPTSRHTQSLVKTDSRKGMMGGGAYTPCCLVCDVDADYYPVQAANMLRDELDDCYCTDCTEYKVEKKRHYMECDCHRLELFFR